MTTATVPKTPGFLRPGNVLLGEKGNFSVITGHVTRSNSIIGYYSVETEHGILYLDGSKEYVVLYDNVVPTQKKREDVCEAKLTSDIETGDIFFGDRSNISVITGDVYPSTALPGFVVAETEHGELYLGERKGFTYLVLA